MVKGQKEDIVNNIKEAISRFLQDDDFIASLADRVSKSLSTILERNKEVINQLGNKLQKVTEENVLLNERVKYLEKSLTKSTIRIHGLETVTKNISTEEVVTNLFNNVLKLNIPINSIVDTYTIKYQVPKNKEQEVGAGEKRTVIVRLNSHRERRLILQSRKHLKNSGIKIYEELSRETMNLYKKAVEKYKRENVWTFEDRVFTKINNMKKVITARDLLD